MKRASKYLAPLCSGLILWASFHPLNLGLLAWVAFVPFLVFVERVGGWRAFLASWLGGWAFFSLGLLWIAHTVPFAPCIIALYKGLYFPAFGFLIRRLRLPLAASAPVAWMGLEYARAHLFGGLPYLLVAYTQHEMLTFIQCSDLFGPWLVSGIVVLVSVVVARAVILRLDKKIVMRDRQFRISCGATGMILLACAIYGTVRLKMDLSDGPRVVVIQPNIPQELKLVMGRKTEEKDRIYATHVTMTEKAVGDGEKRDLIVWPESVLYEGLLYNPVDKVYVTWEKPWDLLYKRVVEPARDFDTSMLLGLEVIDAPPGRSTQETYTNSAILVDPRREVVGRYNKLHLVPFSERIPGPPWVREMVKKYTGQHEWPDFTPGTEQPLFQAGGRKFGVTICFEAIFPEISREIARNGGQFAVNISNEGWFRSSCELDQMLAMNRFRAIESRIAVIRGTNTGISAFIEPTGRYSAIVKGQRKDGSEGIKEVPGTLDARVKISEGGSLYRAIGDVIAWISIAAAAAGVAWRTVARRRAPSAD